MESNSADAAAAASAAASGAPLDLAFLFSLLLSLPFAPVAIVFGDGQQDGARPPEFLQSFFYYEFATKNLN